MIMAVLFVAAFTFATGCTSGGKTLSFGYQPSTHQISYMAAAEKGWWTDNLAAFGVDKIEDYEFPTGAPEMQAMLAGDLDVAYVGAAPVISAIANGLDAKIVASVNINGSDLVVATGVPYETPSNLKGKSIGTFPAGTIQDTILRNWLSENGIDPENDVTIKGMGPGDATAAISAGQIDAVFLPAPSPSIIEADGFGKIVVQSGEMMPNHACCVVLVSGEMIRNNPAIVERIVGTHVMAQEYISANIDEAAEIYVNKVAGTDLETIKSSLNSWDGAWASDPNLIVDSVVDYAGIQYDLGYIKVRLDKDDIFDLSFYDMYKLSRATTGSEPNPTISF